jgi:signal transduction histidine kinase
VTEGSAAPGAAFVAVVAHEMRSPLAVVLGAAKTLQARWPELSDDRRDRFLAMIVDEANRLGALVGDLGDVSRMEAGFFDYAFADVDVSALARAAAAAAAAAQDAVAVVARMPETRLVVRGDAARLRQAIANLIDNAVKYSPAGGEVDVEAAGIDGRVSVDVTDRGGGIAPENHALIFEKLGRVRGPGEQPGTGLGLFIARSIAEAHGGTLAVASVPGRTTFTLTLPAA